ncbi:MAG: hypothetical protein A2622_00235 [Bdellovibrionales bacterium RIFCSPHIGHO2_01_FULL_40_29]|nr:MAG: hypothetical protein A2622_00235 [Bdellovibrionales bacterium RIFCSPHIGHO2_01_FULL_40_29]OFZ32554.1 MAG: hypothetical protein A3D17_04835 [Bdellovibrionales bacterium RIFCSPHIGHO2_02_FULL_40_15]
MVYASFFRRLAASCVDGLILFVPSILVGQVLPGSGTGFGLGIIVGVLYKPVFESSVMAATPGKALLGIAVQGEDGQNPTFKKALIRFFSSYISMMIMGIGYLMQPFTTKRQTLHDMLSECVVIRKETPDFNYFIVWRDQLKSIFAAL